MTMEHLGYFHSNKLDIGKMELQRQRVFNIGTGVIDQWAAYVRNYKQDGSNGNDRAVYCD